MISSVCELLLICGSLLFCFFFKQKTAYEMRISDWSSDVCSSDLGAHRSEDRRLVGIAWTRQRRGSRRRSLEPAHRPARGRQLGVGDEIGRASCRERVCKYV